MAKQYAISYMSRPPKVIQISSETSMHWITTENEKLIKSACSSKTYSRKEDVHRELARIKRLATRNVKGNTNVYMDSE